MKVLHISFSKSFGGMELYMIRLAKKMIGLGLEVFAVCRRDTMLEKALFNENIPYFSLDPIDYIDFFAVKRIKEIIKFNNIDIVHSHTSKDLGLIVPAVSLAGHRVKCVFTMHMDTHCRKKDIYHYLLFKRIDKVFGITDRVSQEVKDSWAIDRPKVETIYNGLDIAQFKKNTVRENIIKNQFNIEDEDRVVGIVGRLESPKGQDTFIEAARYVIRNEKNVKFIIVGGDDLPGKPFLNYLKNRVKELDIEKYIFFTERVNNTADYLKNMDIFVMLSHCEALGLVILEAFSFKLPVIAADTGGVPEIIDDGINGILIPPRDPHIAAIKIQELLNNKELSNDIGERGYQKLEDNFQMNDIVNTIIQKYKNIIKR